MTKRLLVTGINGFVGGHIQSLSSTMLAKQGYELVTPNTELNLLDERSVEAFVDGAHADCVLHLAGQTFVPEAFDNPKETFDVNLTGTYNLLASLKRIGFSGRFLYVSSGDVYGQVSDNALLDEGRLINPGNPYAVSKGAAELLCRQWHNCNEFETLIARPFNHIGPGQSNRFFVSSVAEQIARQEHSEEKPRLLVGDIDVGRDFLHVHDVISAYLALLSNGKAGEIYNICANQCYVLRDIIHALITISGVEVSIERDESKYRRADQRTVNASNTKIINDTGWQAQHTLSETLIDVYQDWKNRLQ